MIPYIQCFAAFDKKVGRTYGATRVNESSTTLDQWEQLNIVQGILIHVAIA